MLRTCLLLRFGIPSKNSKLNFDKLFPICVNSFSTAVNQEETTNCLDSFYSSDSNEKSWSCWWEKKSYGSHPGVCNLPTICIPDQVAKSAQLFLKEYDKVVIATIAQKLDNLLFSRRVCKKKQTLVIPVEKKRKLPLRLSNDDTVSLVNMNKSEYEEELNRKFLKEKEKNRFTYDWKQIEYDELNAASYLLCKSPACYAVSLRVMSEIKARVPNFSPKSILDFGSGTGMCIWAANALWKDSLKQYLCVDSSEAMNNLSFYLFSGGKYDQTLPGLFIRQFLPISFQYNYDIVISAYSLSELPSEKERLHLLKLLWKKTQRYLILIENGNYYGYYIMMEARNLILNGREGANPSNSKICAQFNDPGQVFSPCSHNLNCPKWNIDSCIFSQKYFRPKYFNQIFKDADPSPSEKFAYMVFEKNKDSTESYHKWPRMVSNLQLSHNCVGCHVCTSKGNIENLFVTKSHHGKDLYFVTKKTKLGDSLPLLPTQYSND